MWQCACGQENLVEDLSCATCGTAKGADARDLKRTATGRGRRVETKLASPSPTGGAKHSAVAKSASSSRPTPIRAVVSAPTYVPPDPAASTTRPPDRPATPGSGIKWQWVVGALFAVWVVANLRSCGIDHSPGTPVTNAAPQTVNVPIAESPAAQPVQSSTYETSFNCGLATRWVEQQICATESLADSDRRLAGLYSSAIARAAGADRDSVRQGQRAWLKARSSCGDIPCIEQAYSDRIAFREGWTPTPGQTTDNTGYKTAPQASQPRAQDAPPPGTITCILPYGQEMQGTKSECERLGGSVYN